MFAYAHFHLQLNRRPTIRLARYRNEDGTDADIRADKVIVNRCLWACVDAFTAAGALLRRLTLASDSLVMANDSHSLTHASQSLHLFRSTLTRKGLKRPMRALAPDYCVRFSPIKNDKALGESL